MIYTTRLFYVSSIFYAILFIVLQDIDFSESSNHTDVNDSHSGFDNSNYTNIVAINGTNSTTEMCPQFSGMRCPTPCDPSCKNPLRKRSSCTQPITCDKKDCICNPGFVKDDDGKCILAEHCSEKCPSDEIFKLCPSSCEIHCGNLNNPPQQCPENEREDHECIASCVCRSDFIRDYSSNRCVHKDSCSKEGLMACPLNEEYNKCGQSCETVCRSVNPDLRCQTSNCKSGCFCRTGFIRENYNGKCIPENKCFNSTLPKDVP